MALNPYFSKRQINDFSTYIQQCAERLCNRLMRDYKGTSKVANLDDAWAAYTTDVITFYSFAWSYDFLDSPNFANPFTTSTRGLAKSAHVAVHFPWFLKFIQSVPDTIVGIVNPAMRPVFQFQNASSKPDFLQMCHRHVGKAHNTKSCCRKSSSKS